MPAMVKLIPFLAATSLAIGLSSAATIPWPNFNSKNFKRQADGTSCQEFSQDTLKDLPDNVLQALLKYAYDQSGEAPVKNADDPLDVNKFRANNGIGLGYHSSNDHLNVEFYLPGPNDINEGYNVSPLMACYGGDAHFSDEIQDRDNCAAFEDDTSGKTVDAGTSVSVTIQTGFSVEADVSTSQEQSYTAGITFGVQYGFSEISDVHADVSFSYTYTSDRGITDSKSTQVSQSTTLEIAPLPGQVCNLVVTDITCPGSVKVTLPVVFRGNIVAHYFDGMGNQHYYDRPKMQDVMQTYDYLYNSATASSIVQTIKTNYHNMGHYEESCTCVDQSKCGDQPDTPTVDTTYAPIVQCPISFGVIPNACQTTLPDYTQNGVSGDTNQWQAKGVTIQQSPPPGTQIGYGTTQVYMKATAANGNTATCQGLMQVVPPWLVDFTADVLELQYPAPDGSSVVGGYTVGYSGSCDAAQGGACHITNITSTNAPNFQYKALSTHNSPKQSFRYTNGQADWPFDDELTFALQCSDPYGNQGGALVYQHAYRDQVIVTDPGATTTTTLHTATDYLSTSVVTLHTAVVTPEATVTQHMQTIYTETDYTSTRTITAAGASVETQYIATTLSESKTVNATSTASTSTVTDVSSLPPPSATLTKTATINKYGHTKTVTPTVSTRKTVTHKAKPTKCHHPRNMERRARSTGTTTTYDPAQTTTVTDASDTMHITASGTTTSTDLVDVLTQTASVTRTIYDVTDTAYASAASTGVKTVVDEAYTTTDTLTVTQVGATTATVTTAPLATTLVTSYIGQPSTLTTTVNSTRSVHGTTTVTAAARTVTLAPVTTTVRPPCTR